MKNNLKYLLIFVLTSFISINDVKANEPFLFEVTEIEILNNGNKIYGYKGGTATTEDGSTITANNFYYNKLTNILETTGNVRYFDKIKKIIITTDKAIYLKNDEKIFSIGNSKAVSDDNNIQAHKLEYDKINNIFKAKKEAIVKDLKKDTTIYADEITYLKNDEKVYSIGNSKAVNQNNTITALRLEYDKINNIFKAKKEAIVKDLKKDTTIYADEITYFKNDEKIFTEGKTKALIEKKYIFNSKDVTYLRNTEKLFSQNKSSLKDDSGNIYKLDNFSYNIAEEVLSGKKVEVLAKVDGNKIDQYFFSEGLFNFKEKSHIAKETKIKTHKDVFGDKNHDPRIYGSSSISEKNKTIIKNGIFTSCKFNDNCPPWSIKSEEITHDKIKKDIIYKNAILKIYNVPVLYFPKFFHPDPTVKRRSGFLQPQFNSSQTLGSSLYVPYFKTLGPSKDLTFNPTIFEDNKYTLQNEFREKGKDYSLNSDFALTKNYKSSSDNKTKDITHFFLNYNKDLSLPDFTNSNIDINVQRVSNDTYLKVFESSLIKTPLMPNNKDLMETTVSLSLDNESYDFNAGLASYEKLGVKNNDRYQFVFPYYDFYKEILADKTNGIVSISFNGSNTLSDTNKLMTSITNNIEYKSNDYVTNYGFKNNFSLYFKNFNTIAKDDPAYTSSANIDGMSLIQLDTIFPLLKKSDKIIENLTPKVSFRINPGDNMDNFSGNNKKVEAGNVFDTNRLGLNAYEAGKSLTIGLDYKIDVIETEEKENVKDKYFSFHLATVFRDQYEKGIPVTSTINKKNSDIFGSINNHLLENINFGYNFSLDNDLKTLNSNSINTKININNFVTEFNFIEEGNEIGSTHLLSNSTQFKIDDNSSFKFSTQRNKEINLTEFYNLSYEYKNDCLTAALKFNKTFYQDQDLKPTEDLFFTITLIPLTTYEKEIYKKTPGQSGLNSWFR